MIVVKFVYYEILEAELEARLEENLRRYFNVKKILEESLFFSAFLVILYHLLP